MGTEIRATLGEVTRRLSLAGVPSPQFDAAELVASVLGCERRDLVRRAGLDAAQREQLEIRVVRREQRVPLQHITGVCFFRYLTLQVGQGVFIPRPETELVAQAVIDEVRGRDGAVVVDLGTGSGAIAIAVATEAPGARVHAVEVDPGALPWARRNIAALAPSIDLRSGDLASAFPDLDFAVDVVVSNPPYIPPGSVPVDPEVRDHDPSRALYGSGADGLDEVRAVVRTAARLLRPGGLLVIEHADAQGTSAPAVLTSDPAAATWRDVSDHQDLAGRPRYLTARRP